MIGSHLFMHPWTRRTWITRTATAVAGTTLRRGRGNHPSILDPRAVTSATSASSAAAYNTVATNTAEWERLVQEAVGEARRAGAQYADARVTHTVLHPLSFVGLGQWTELMGFGVRALYQGCWGFASAPDSDVRTIHELARQAVAQAKINARATDRGPSHSIELGAIPAVTGRWTMPVEIDPFTISMDEKLAYMQYWVDYAPQFGTAIDTLTSHLYNVRQESVLATSDGTCCTQVTYESGGKIVVRDSRYTGLSLPLLCLTPAGKGWELFLEADIPEQLRTMQHRFDDVVLVKGTTKPAQIGRYTMICDGATMAALLDKTLGLATQLDRALGYEANASGTSFLNDPLAMLGTFQVASPLVTVMANRSAPGQLATVKWDAEGVAPDDFTLIKKGVLVDYQTTREQVAWLGPYYQKHQLPPKSHGCAAVDSGLSIPLQHSPNLELLPTPNGDPNPTKLDDMIASVKEGILLTEGDVHSDFQARSGFINGTMREIKNGRLGRVLIGAAIAYDTLEFWKNIAAIGGPSTRAVIASTPWTEFNPCQAVYDRFYKTYPVKGEPPQRVSYSVGAVAATITNQAMINLLRKA